MQQSKSNKQKTQQVLATLVMGMSLVNTVTPVAAAMQNVPEQIDALPVPTQTEAQPLEYTFLPHTLDFVENMVFGKAEAKDIPAGKVDKLEAGDEMKVSAGEVGSIKVNEGNQYIFSGGTGLIDTMNVRKSVYIYGRQVIDANGFGKIETLNRGVQTINSGGSGNIVTMNSGTQEIRNTSGNIVTMNDGIQTVYGGLGTINNMNSGIQQIFEGGTGKIAEQKDGMQSIMDGVGTTVKMNGGRHRIGERGTSLNTTMLNGVINFFGEGGKLINATVHGGEVLLPSGVAHGGNYNFGGDFTFDGGFVDMTRGFVEISGGVFKIESIDSYETLTIENLKKGGGTFVMNTDLESEKDSDKITIKNADAGTSYIKVVDKSLKGTTPVSADKKLRLIIVEKGKANFVGKEINTGGLWSVVPTIKNGKDIGESEKEWYLTNLDKKVNKDTKVLLEGSDNAYALWRNTNDTMRKRLGELHLRDDTTDGIWARYTGGKFGSDSFNGSYHMYQLGYDKAVDDNNIYGLALEKGSGKGNYSFGSSKDKLFAASLYGVWTKDDGSYTDVVAKIGQFNSDVKSHGDYPDKADYKNSAYSLSVEHGKTIELDTNGQFIEPQVQLIIGRLGSADYTTDRGNKVHLGGVNSCIGRLGFVVGQKAESDKDVYLKASVLHEFSGKRDVHMASAGDSLDISKDYGDTWLELGVGTNIKLSKAGYFYGDVERSFGADIKKKWQVNAGLRFAF